MTVEEYRSALEAASREYEQLAAQRAELDGRLAQLAQTIGSLTRLCGYTPTVSWGLTDGCRMILRAAGRPLTAVDVRDMLANFGFDMSKYANDLSVVHTVLKRLNESGETRFVEPEPGKDAYVWSGSSWVMSWAGRPAVATAVPTQPARPRPRRRK